MGNSLSTPPYNTPGNFASVPRFPHVGTGDVVAQERLMREALGVEELALVVGSMGAQQIYEWAVRLPENVREGLVQHGLVWSVMGLPTEWWKRERWRPLGFASAEDFRAGFVDTYFSVLDPNSLLAQGWKWQRGNVGRHTDGDLAVALGCSIAKTFAMPISEDMFFPRDCAAEQRVIANSELRVIENVSGNWGLFGFETTFMEQVDRHLGELLA